MGCDIHWAMERRRISGGSGQDLAGSWEFVMDDHGVPAGDRWYAFFAQFGVRGSKEDDKNPPLANRGWPQDLSDRTRKKWLGDHSFTWATLIEFYSAYARILLATGVDEDPSQMFGLNFFVSDYLSCDAKYEGRLIIGFDS